MENNSPSSSSNEASNPEVEQPEIATQQGVNPEEPHGEYIPNFTQSSGESEAGRLDVELSVQIGDGTMCTANNFSPDTDSRAYQFQNSGSTTPTKSASTPKGLRQVSLLSFFEKTPEKKSSGTLPITSTSASPPTVFNTTPIRSASIGSGKKRKTSGDSSSLSPTKKQNRQLQLRSIAHESNRAISNNEDDLNSNLGPDATATTDNEACDDDGLGGTAQHFSIHRLSVDKLRKRFDEKKDLSEVELIENVIKEINEKQTETGFKNRNGSLPLPNTDTNSTCQENDLLFGYQVLVYVQKLEQIDDFLFNFKVYDNTIRLNKIVFYYRPGDIYALTIGPTWQATQVYSCYDFPCYVSGRLTSTQGNTQEIAMHLTGNVRVSKSIKKNPTSFDQLKTVMLNVIKPLKDDCSLYRLREFKNSDRQTKLQIGLAYVRIKKRMDLKNLPEILNHFTKICNGEVTYSVVPNRVSAETQANDFPYIHGVSGEEASEAENKLYKLVNGFIHNTNLEVIKKFDIVDKYKDDFYNAETYKLTYDNRGSVVKTLAVFKSCPTALQIFSAIREKCGTELTGDDIQQHTFTTRIKKHIKIEFTVKGRKEPIRRSIMDLIEGEMNLNSIDYWRLMGRWLVVRDDYYYRLQREFLDFLKNDEGFFINPLKANLHKLWNEYNVRNVRDFCKLYENVQGYYLPPDETELKKISSHLLESNGTGADVEALSSGDEVEDNHFFDMMKISTDENGKHEFWFYYVFDRFDAGVRDASTRITKSIEMLLNDTTVYPTVSLLEKYWTHCLVKKDYFRTVFGSFESFHKHLTTGSVHIIVAFATRNRQLNVQYSSGTIPMFTTTRHANQTHVIEEDIPAPTLERERNLRLDLTFEDLRFLLDKFESEHLNTMCNELQVSRITDDDLNHNLDDLTNKVMDRMVEKGYFLRKESSVEVTGKLLKLRNHSNFSVFDNGVANQIVFTELRSLFITGFPGFIHKLECLQIHENISKMVRLKLNIVEI